MAKVAFPTQSQCFYQKGVQYTVPFLIALIDFSYIVLPQGRYATKYIPIKAKVRKHDNIKTERINIVDNSIIFTFTIK